MEQKKPPRIAAFSGTRRGMTEAQRQRVRALLIELGITHLEHGAAIGADEQASLIARELGLRITARPGNIESERSALAVADFTTAPDAPLARNRVLVDRTHLLIAAPDGPQRRSGTWATITYARGRGKTVWIVMPDGGAAEG